MVRTVVDVHVFDQATTNTVFGQHAFHHAYEEGMNAGLDVFVERFLHQDLGGELTLAAGVAGVVEVDAVGHFFASQTHFVGVDDDDVVATFYVGRIGGFVFAAQQFGNFCAKTAKNLVGCIDNDPFVLNLLSIGEFGAVANGIHLLIC